MRLVFVISLILVRSRFIVRYWWRSCCRFWCFQRRTEVSFLCFARDNYSYQTILVQNFTTIGLLLYLQHQWKAYRISAVHYHALSLLELSTLERDERYFVATKTFLEN